MDLASLNPFRLHGPAFLAFYLALTFATVGLLRLWLRLREREAPLPPPRFDDPYLIAHLRGGTEEALRVATVSLVDRGLLVVRDDKLCSKGNQVERYATRPVEQAVLKALREIGGLATVLADRGAQAACAAYQRQLEQHGLLAGPEVRAARLPAYGLALALLLGTAIVRVVHALMAGRGNVGFLVGLGLLAAFLVWRTAGRRLTAAGDAAIADLQTLFKRLKERSSTLQAGGKTNEMALLAAVFGIGALPLTVFPFVATLFPPPRSDSSSGSGGDSGSSCSSSSCGGGCGGGGCGG